MKASFTFKQQNDMAKKSLNMKLPDALYERLKQHAARERRAISNLAELILEDWVVREDMKESRRATQFTSEDTLPAPTSALEHTRRF